MYFINQRFERKHKFYENAIITIAQQNPKIEILIKWIPGHCQIEGNEKADQAAKEAISEIDIEELTTLIPKEDLINIIKCKIIEKWTIKYQEMCVTKGIFNSKINNNIPPKILWFKNKKINAKHIKIITRLRTNHAYNKFYKHLIRVEESPNCITCDCPENNEHLIKNCTKYASIRDKYKVIKDTQYEPLIKNPNNYKTIIKFIEEANIEI